MQHPLFSSTHLSGKSLELSELLECKYSHLSSSQDAGAYAPWLQGTHRKTGMSSQGDLSRLSPPNWGHDA